MCGLRRHSHSSVPINLFRIEEYLFLIFVVHLDFIVHDLALPLLFVIHVHFESLEGMLELTSIAANNSIKPLCLVIDVLELDDLLPAAEIRRHTSMKLIHNSFHGPLLRPELHITVNVVNVLFVLRQCDIHVVLERELHKLRSLLLFIIFERIKAHFELVLLKLDCEPHRRHILQVHVLLVLEVVLPRFPDFTQGQQPVLGSDNSVTSPCVE